MKQRIARTVLSLILALSLVTPAFAGTLDETLPLTAVTVNGAEAAFSAQVFGGTAYVPFYHAVTALRPDAVITWEEGRFIAAAWDFTMTVRVGDPYLEINGRYLYIKDKVKGEADGTAWVPVRVLAAALGAWVGWDGKVDLYGGGTPLKGEDRPYDDATLDLMARVIQHESGYEPFEGKLGVGSVIMNRVNGTTFSDKTVYEIVYAPNQFPGATNATPNADSILAARLCLEGANVVPGALYFNGVGKPCWASRNKALIKVIGNHAFYG